MPKQLSSGGRARLFGISKRGDRYLRTLMIHGARAALGKAAGKQDPRSLWVSKLRQRRPSQCRGCRVRQQECEDRVGHALHAGLAGIQGVKLPFLTKSNVIFADLPKHVIERLRSADTKSMRARSKARRHLGL
ncbi:transposase [Mesorhizobium sp. M1060]|uniref:transposase n=1 Tax=Mesorhizobium sp. M1060 TaxID=2957052 RepID=UPI0033391438